MIRWAPNNRVPPTWPPTRVLPEREGLALQRWWECWPDCGQWGPNICPGTHSYLTSGQTAGPRWGARQDHLPGPLVWVVRASIPPGQVSGWSDKTHCPEGLLYPESSVSLLRMQSGTPGPTPWAQEAP